MRENGVNLARCTPGDEIKRVRGGNIYNAYDDGKEGDD